MSTHDPDDPAVRHSTATVMGTAPSRGVAILGGMTAAVPPPRSSFDEADEEVEGSTTSIRVATEGSTVVIAVAGELDVTTGEALIDAAEAAVATGPSRLDIDLRALQQFDEAGAGALASCRELGAKLAEGLHYRTGRGPGRDALLAAYSELDGEAVAE
jgi:ABC-type transporter Mla MlaB component